MVRLWLVYLFCLSLPCESFVTSYSRFAQSTESPVHDQLHCKELDEPERSEIDINMTAEAIIAQVSPNVPVATVALAALVAPTDVAHAGYTRWYPPDLFLKLKWHQANFANALSHCIFVYFQVRMV